MIDEFMRPACGEETQAPEPERKPWISITRKDVVEAIILIVVVAAFAAYFVYAGNEKRRGRERARSFSCLFNLRQIGAALQKYHDDHGRFPPPYTVDEEGNRLHSWRTLLLPYFVDEKRLYEKIRLDEPYDSEHNRQFLSVGVYEYRCPAHPRTDSKAPETWTDYVMITGPGTIGDTTEGTTIEAVTDSHGTTVIIAEVARSKIHWMEPHDYSLADGPRRLVGRTEEPTGPADLGSEHPDVVNMLTVDGDVLRVPQEIDEETFTGLMTVSGGEEVSLPEL